MDSKWVTAYWWLCFVLSISKAEKAGLILVWLSDLLNKYMMHFQLCWTVDKVSNGIYSIDNLKLSFWDRLTKVSNEIYIFSQFLEDFQTLISSVSTSPHEFLITGDFNIPVDDLTDANAIQFLSLLDHANLTQHVSFPTHRHSHTLHLVITSANCTLSPTVISLPISPTDHMFICYHVFIEDY